MINTLVPTDTRNTQSAREAAAIRATLQSNVAVASEVPARTATRTLTKIEASVLYDLLRNKGFETIFRNLCSVIRASDLADYGNAFTERQLARVKERILLGYRAMTDDGR